MALFRPFSTFIQILAQIILQLSQYYHNYFVIIVKSKLHNTITIIHFMELMDNITINVLIHGTVGNQHKQLKSIITFPGVGLLSICYLHLPTRSPLTGCNLFYILHLQNTNIKSSDINQTPISSWKYKECSIWKITKL